MEKCKIRRDFFRKETELERLDKLHPIVKYWTAADALELGQSPLFASAKTKEIEANLVELWHEN